MNAERCRDALKQLEPTTKEQGSRLAPSKTSARHTAHQHCPFSPGSSITCLFLNLCTAFDVRAPAHAVHWFPLTHFKPDWQLLCLFTAHNLTLCDASQCSEQRGETMEQPSCLGKATSAARSPEEEKIGTVWGLVPPSPPTAAPFF